MTPVQLLDAAYAPLLALANRADEEVGWTPTRLPGWTVRDLLLHLATDGQRALVALATPAPGPVDTDEVGYWDAWRPDTAGAQAGLRSTRIIASVWTSVRGPADLYAETARAVLVAAGRSELDALVLTQGRTLRVRALLHTLAVEACVHHLDLAPVLDEPPAAAVLAEVRRVLDALAGSPAPPEWDDARYVRLATGRAPLTEEERRALGVTAGRYPLFG